MHTLLISDNLYLHSIYINENAIKTHMNSNYNILLQSKIFGTISIKVVYPRTVAPNVCPNGPNAGLYRFDNIILEWSCSFSSWLVLVNGKSGTFAFVACLISLSPTVSFDFGGFPTGNYYSKVWVKPSILNPSLFFKAKMLVNSWWVDSRFNAAFRYLQSDLNLIAKT